MPVNVCRCFLRKQGKGMHISAGALVSDSAEPLTTNGCETNGNDDEQCRGQPFLLRCVLKSQSDHHYQKMSKSSNTM